MGQWKVFSYCNDCELFLLKFWWFSSLSLFNTDMSYISFTLQIIHYEVVFVTVWVCFVHLRSSTNCFEISSLIELFFVVFVLLCKGCRQTFKLILLMSTQMEYSLYLVYNLRYFVPAFAALRIDHYCNSTILLD